MPTLKSRRPRTREPRPVVNRHITFVTPEGDVTVTVEGPENGVFAARNALLDYLKEHKIHIRAVGSTVPLGSLKRS